jgi:hypothetical protein
MMNFRTLALLGAVLAASAPFASADSLTLGSFGQAGLGSYNPPVTVANTYMNYVGSETFGSLSALTSAPGPVITTGSGTEAFDLNPMNPIWPGPIANSSWVGIAANAGPNAGPTVNPAYGYYEFTTTFTAVGGSFYSGSLSIYADDTVEVLLNGGTLVSFGALGGNGHCADGQPNCTAPALVDPLNNISLLTGTNTLTFIVEQAGTENVGQDPSGVDFAATLTQPTIIPTPEPNSLILLGTGLIGAAGILMRKRLTA